METCSLYEEYCNIPNNLLFAQRCSKTCGICKASMVDQHEPTASILTTTSIISVTASNPVSTTTFSMDANQHTSAQNCNDELRTCSENISFCTAANDLFRKLCRKTCGVCGEMTSLLILNSDEFGSKRALMYNIDTHGIHHIW